MSGYSKCFLNNFTYVMVKTPDYSNSKVNTIMMEIICGINWT